MTKKIQNISLRKKNPPVASVCSTPPCSSQRPGMSQPPKKSVVTMAQTVTTLAYSAMKKKRELHRAVLGVVAGDQLRLGLGQVERQPVGLGEARDQEDEEREEQRQHVPEAGLLVADDGGEADVARS